MFNIIVAADKEQWEGNTGRFSLYEKPRFGEFSGDEFRSAGISLKKAASLKALEGIPTLLIYENRPEPYARTVRVVTLRDIILKRDEITFGIDPVGKIPREYALNNGQLLQADRDEFSRTHWAVKDGKLPLNPSAVTEA